MLTRYTLRTLESHVFLVTTQNKITIYTLTQGNRARLCFHGNLDEIYEIPLKHEILEDETLNFGSTLYNNSINVKKKTYTSSCDLGAMGT